MPALDAVLFLTPRNSQIDVVQSVGRVMRKIDGKKRGYVVLPVVIPAGKEPHEALNDNETYRVVWQVLNALRAHDDRFDAMVNKLSLIGQDTTKMEVIAISDKIARRPRSRGGSEGTRIAARKRSAVGGNTIGIAGPGGDADAPPAQATLEFDIGEIERAIYAKLVDKVGNRRHWEEWAKDIAEIAATHIDRIKGILENKKNKREIEAFESFRDELRDDLNPSISDDDVIEMLAQHMVTKPVFDALFAGHSFATENSMSRAMQSVLDVLHEHHLEKESSTLKAFYDSVRLRAEGITNAEGKQKIVLELYDKFFSHAFKKMSDRLGIVYTPVEIVDFILKSVDHLLRTEFGQTLGSKGVHILDPFTGTGTFITRLMQTGLLSKEELRASTRTRSTRTRSCCSPITSRRSTSRPRTTTSWAASTRRSRGSASRTPSSSMRRTISSRVCSWTTAREGRGRRSSTFASSWRTRRTRWGRRARTTTTQNVEVPHTRRTHRRDLRRALQREAQERALRQLRARDPMGERSCRRQRHHRLRHERRASSRRTPPTVCASASPRSSAASTCSTCEATSAPRASSRGRREGKSSAAEAVRRWRSRFW